MIQRITAADCAAELECSGRDDATDTTRPLEDVDLRINAMGLWHCRKHREERERKGGH